MKKGIVVIAHNNRDVDYAKMAVVSAKFAKKNLQLPVSLITDESTKEWMVTSKLMPTAVDIFENIISVPRPVSGNQRILHDGTTSSIVPFLNSNRSSIWDYTPYEKTLMIDSDFLIMTDVLNNYWEIDQDVLLGQRFNDIQGDRKGYLDDWTSETGVHLYWATTVMFTKNENSRIFFKLIDFIKDNYKFYADLFRFDPRQYRNDITFSIAYHILNGFEFNRYSLPAILTVQGKDILEKIHENGRMIFSIKYWNDDVSFYLASIKDQDIHIINKQSIIRNYEGLINL
jgi:hypothetical protein